MGLKLPAYTIAEIEQYLKSPQTFLLETRAPAFDMVRFQSHLFSAFFNAIERGELLPNDVHFKEVTAYLVKKTAEQVASLCGAAEAANDSCTALCGRLDAKAKDEGASVAPEVTAALAFIRRILEVCRALDGDVAKAAGACVNGQSVQVSRHRCVYLFFVIALLSDGVKMTADWTARVNTGGVAEFTGDEKMNAIACRATAFLLGERPADPASPSSLLFSADPLTERELRILDEAMAGESPVDDMASRLVPCFSATGAQGITAMLHAIFHGGSLLTCALAPTGQQEGRRAATGPHPVHDGAYEGWYMTSMTHDTAHLSSMLEADIYRTFAANFLPIYEKLATTPASGMSDDEVLQRKQDLYVIFHILHEDPEMFTEGNEDDTFLQRARVKFDRTFEVVDTVKILNSLGFDIPPVTGTSPVAAQKACFAATADAMNTLWVGFLSRHGKDLDQTAFHQDCPGYFD